MFTEKIIPHSLPIDGFYQDIELWCVLEKITGGAGMCEFWGHPYEESYSYYKLISCIQRDRIESEVMNAQEVDKYLEDYIKENWNSIEDDARRYL